MAISPMLTFLHISDTHINPDPQYIKFYADVTPLVGAKALVHHINNLPFDVDFVLHTGDVAYDPDPEAYAMCREILGEIKYPVHYVAGNHDDSPTLQEMQLDRVDPRPYLHYAFEVNGVQIIVVDSNGPTDPPAGYMTDSQLEWLNGLCRAGDERPLVIAVHHNVLPVGVPWLDNYMGIQNGIMFHEAILPAKDRIRGVFFGHVHQNIEVIKDGILYTSCLSSWAQFMSYPGMTHTTPDAGAEHGFNLVSVFDDQTFIRRFRYPLPKNTDFQE